MNWEAVSGIAEIVGAVVVVVSLIYVGVQVRQNTSATRYQATQNLIAGMSDAHFLISSDGELAAIMRRGGYNRSSLTDDEQLRYNMWLFSLFNQYDFAFHQFRAGELDENIWGKLEYEVPQWISSLPGVREWWDQDKIRMSKDFVDYIEKKVSDSAGSQSLPTMPQPTDTT